MFNRDRGAPCVRVLNGFWPNADAPFTLSPSKALVKRGQTVEEDDALKCALATSEKEQAENVMIVDLVRNDLSRVAAADSVCVDELFGIHTFSTVHQMISSVSCTLAEGVTPLDIMQATFPMGSMTGAPKLSAMRHIAAMEEAGRGGVQRGAGLRGAQRRLGFERGHPILDAPRETGRVDATFGGAITLLADAQEEYQECLLKAEAARQCLVP